jgi:hypothetical protein
MFDSSIWKEIFPFCIHQHGNPSKVMFDENPIAGYNGLNGDLRYWTDYDARIRVL